MYWDNYSCFPFLWYFTLLKDVVYDMEIESLAALTALMGRSLSPEDLLFGSLSIYLPMMTGVTLGISRLVFGSCISGLTYCLSLVICAASFVQLC